MDATMKIFRPIAFTFITAVALIATHFAADEVFAQTECVQPLTSVTTEDGWSGDCLSQNREGAYARFYTFSLLRQSDVTITLESETDPYLFLLRGSGTNAGYLAENDDIDTGSRNFNSRIARTLEPGEYTIEATTYKHHAVGDFTLTVRGVGSPDDRAALVALYHAANGDNWDDNDNWLTDASLSDWHGVDTDVNGRVTDLDLDHNSLTGYIPPEIGNLIELTSLGLGGNRLTGTVPTELGKLTGLAVLDLSSNRLWGQFPRSMTALTRLILLNSLSNSGLCVPDDAEFQEWLQSIPTGFAQYHICIPESVTPDAGDLAVLTAFYSATDGDNWEDNTNWLSEQPIQYWKGVTINPEGRVIKLLLRGNNLSGYIPSQLGNLSALQSVLLHFNQLTGGIPAEMGNLTSLEELSLRDNQLSGSIPDELGRLSELRRLTLEANQLTGDIPAELGNLTNLKRLLLDHNQLSGSIPLELGDLANLEYLNIEDNRLTGEIPSELGALANLTNLDLDGNQLSGTIPAELGNLEAMVYLDLDDNQLSGAIPYTLGNLTDLASLDLSGNLLSGDIPPELGNLTDLRNLILINNELSGPIPAQLGNLSSLVYLNIVNNHLSGQIPAELGDLTNLRHMLLGNNQLTGNIPSELGNLKNLERLILDINQLTEEIPPELGDLGELEWLWLDDNQLSGEIPTELGNLRNLSALRLDDNRLTGPVPSELGGLSLLEILEVQHNELTSALPDDLAELSRLGTLLFHDNAGLCAPGDAEFQDWLLSIDNVEGPTCEDTAQPPPDPTPTPPECVQLLSGENVIDGTWTTDCVSNIPAPQGSGTRYARHYTFTINIASDVTITLSSGQDTFLYLRAGMSTDGALLHENDDYNYPMSTDSRIEETLDAGTYTIEATTYSAKVTGDFILTIYGTDPFDDRTALIALYNATNGDNWYDSTNWLTDAPLGYWYGVTTDEEGRVTEITLGHNRLTGHLPVELGRLDRLKTLSVRVNQVSGTIPTTLFNLPNLQGLFLSNNRFSGTIPPEIGNLASIKIIHIGETYMEGPIPPEMGRLSNLEVLYLDDNELTLPSKTLAELGSLENLQALGLSSLGLTGEFPREFANLSNLRQLRLWNNEYSGTIPAELSSLRNMESLQLGRNRLSGEIPPELATLPDLQLLDLQENQLTGSIPAEFGRLSNLESLYLETNRLTGGIPPELGNLTGLNELYLHSNQLSGPIPSTLGNLISVDDLFLHDNQLSGTISESMTHLRELSNLTLRGNKLTGCVPYGLTDAQDNDLDELGLPYCEYTDRDALVALYDAARGYRWHLRTDWLTDTHLSEWYGVDTNGDGRVTRIDLEANNLSGHLTHEFGRLTFLKWVDISLNSLEETLPHSLTDLAHMDYFYFDNNAGLCAPADVAFKTWAESLEDFRGDMCEGEPPSALTNSIPSQCIESLGFVAIEGRWDSECASISRTEFGSHFARYYPFTLDEPTTVELTLESSTDPYLILLNEVGDIVDENDDVDYDGRNVNSRITATLPAGDYIVESTTYDGSATGDFELSLSLSED